MVLYSVLGAWISCSFAPLNLESHGLEDTQIKAPLSLVVCLPGTVPLETENMMQGTSLSMVPNQFCWRSWSRKSQAEAIVVVPPAQKQLESFSSILQSRCLRGEVGSNIFSIIHSVTTH